MSNLSVVRLNGVDYNLEDENVRAMIAPTEASSTASAAHATGTYFILADTLYTATADIAIGDTIAVGTNCAAVPAGISNKLGNEVADLKSALNTPINIGGQSVGSGQVIYSSGGIGTSSTFLHTDYIDLTGIERIVYARFCSTSTTTNAGMAFYDSNKDFINDGQRVKLGQDAAHYELTELDVPENAVYARFTIAANLNGFAVYDYEDYQKYLPVWVDRIENTVNDQGAEIDEINDILYKDEPADLAASFYKKFFINSSNKWSSSGDCLIQKIIDGTKYVTVTANSDANAVIAFLTSNSHVLNAAPAYATGTGRIVISPETTERYAVPSDAKYIYIQKRYSTTNNTPESVYYYVLSVSGIVTIPPLGLHEMPASTNILNIIKRARQLTDIKWTPAVDLDRFMRVQVGGAPVPDTASGQFYLGTFKAGKEYTGVPYGRVSDTVDDYGYSYGTVGHYIGFDTFISSVENPLSRLSIADIGNSSQHKSVIYAAVCSGLTCYALDVNEVPTANIGNISGLALVGKLNDNGTLLSDSRIKLGDVLNLAGDHTGIITDIIRDENGIIQFVEIAEAAARFLANRNYSDGAVGGLCVRQGWTRDQLYDSVWWGEYSVYRYSGDVSYTPSSYVNVGDEFDSYAVRKFPIMPYEGQGFVYKTGHIPNDEIKLVITLDGYSYVKVFKDGVEITGSPYSVTSDGNNGINPISVTETGVGEYTAYLCNISGGNVTNLTYACHWTIES